ncbi:acyltransferase family protein [Streptomyces sp. NPDC008079]|uniref:acyltransferase family protein n=1 Tax=Streptomyces sp. NPDC008079 TaxID=3364806 RepID=UPI0036E92CF2
MSTVVRGDAAPTGSAPLPDLAPVPEPAAGGKAGSAAPQPKKRLYVLDGLRLIAALMVVAYHYMGFDDWFESPWGKSSRAVFPGVHEVAGYGWLGVELFFLISGFVICMSCWGRTPKQFAVSRFVRLYPAYWFAIAVTTTVLVTRPGGTTLAASDVLTNVTMFQELLGAQDVDGVYWSLWVELRFYLLFMVVAMMGLTYRRVVTFCIAWLLLAGIAPQSGIDLLQLMIVPQYAAFFVSGIVIYLMHRVGPTPILWLLLGASWLMAQNQLTDLVASAEASTHTNLSWWWSLAVVSIFYGLVLGAALGKLNFFNWRWLTVAGAMTYPLYLLHEDIGWEIIRHTHGVLPARILVPALVAVMLLAAWLVHTYVETPLAKALKNWLLPKKPAKPAKPVPAPTTGADSKPPAG